jgi:hypothetical protein
MKNCTADEKMKQVMQWTLMHCHNIILEVSDNLIAAQHNDVVLVIISATSYLAS